MSLVQAKEAAASTSASAQPTRLLRDVSIKNTDRAFMDGFRAAKYIYIGQYLGPGDIPVYVYYDPVTKQNYHRGASGIFQEQF